MLNEDYRDILHALSDEKVKFLLIGAYAMAAHGYPRATMDIDIWVMPSPQNADAVLLALRRFGAPLHNLTKEDLQKGGKGQSGAFGALGNWVSNSGQTLTKLTNIPGMDSNL